MDTKQNGIGLNQVLEIWRRRKWPAILLFGATFTLAASIIEFLPDVYHSSAVLLVQSQQVPAEMVRSTVTNAVEKRVQTISQAILSRTRLEGLINSFGLYDDLKQQLSSEEIIERMRDDISLEFAGINQAGQQRTGPSTTVAFTISYSGRDARKVATIANTLASYYIEEDLKSRERQAGGTTEFLKSQIDEMKKKLDDQEQQVTDFRQKHSGEMLAGRDTDLVKLEGVNAAILQNSQKQLLVRERKASLERQLADVSLGDADSQLGTIMERAQELQASLKAAQGDLRALAAEEATLRTSLALYQGRVTNRPEREQEFVELSRDHATTQDVYASLLKRYEEAKVSESMEHRQKGEQFQLLEPAIPSERPAAPNRPRLLFVALGVALALAAALVAVLERLDTSFHAVDELRAFSRVPLLVSIPRIVTQSDTARARRRFQIAAFASICGLFLLVGGSYVIARGNQRLVTAIETLGGRGK